MTKLLSYLKSRFSLRFVLLFFSFIAALIFGLQFQLPVLQQLAFFIFWILLFSIVIHRLNFMSLDLSHLTPDHVYARDSFDCRISLSNKKKILDSFGILIEYELLANGRYFNRSELPVVPRQIDALQIPVSSAGEKQTLDCEAQFQRRGFYRNCHCYLRSDFPFGIFHVSREIILPLNMFVYPEPADVTFMSEILGWQGGEEAALQTAHVAHGEFCGLRDFQPGDSLKGIHWPLSVRHQDYVVKEYSPLAPRRLCIIFHSFAPDAQWQRESFDQALSVLCGMFHYCWDHEFEFEFIASFNDWQEIEVKHEHDFHELMENLSMAKEKQDREFEQLEQLVHSKMDHKCLVYSNTPCHFWEDRLPNVVQCLDNTILEDPYAFQD